MYVFYLWLISATVFLAVMYPMFRLRFILTVIGSVILIWVGWERNKKSSPDKIEINISGREIIKKALRTFGFIGLSIGGAAILLLHYMIEM